MKNEDFDNLSDKRFKDIVDAYKRNHLVDKKNSNLNLNKEANENNNNNNNCNKQELQLPILKRAKSRCADDLNLQEKRTNLHLNENIANDKQKNQQQSSKRRIHFENEDVNQNINDYNNDNDYERNKDAVRKYQTFNKNNIHLFDFNSHPSKFFNQN